MKLLIFTEGTIIMHGLAKNVNREERVRQSKEAGIQREEINIAFETNTLPPKASPGTPYDLDNYIPIGNATEKITKWKNQGAEIIYLTSRRLQSEVETIKRILEKYHFPDYQNLYFRRKGENYKDVAELLFPNMIIEDDCESIGGEKEMTYPRIKEELKKRIKSIVVKEFEGVDNLQDKITLL